MKKYYISFCYLILSHSISANPLHIGDRIGPMSEILCNQESAWDIFTCEIIENYRYENSIQHIAIVEERFRGSIPDTIQLAVTYIGCTMGRITMTKMIPGSRHLIFGIKQKNGQYYTRYGYQWHSGILNVKINEDYKEIEERSKKYLETIREFKALQVAQYTGPVSLRVEDYFSAEGQFLNGQPEGKWEHTDLEHEIKIIVNYKKGSLHGKKYIVGIEKEVEYYSFVQTYKNGALVNQTNFLNNDPTRISKQYFYVKNGASQSSTHIAYDSMGIKVSEKTQLRSNYCFSYQSVLNGQFIDKSNSRYQQQPHSEGNYHYGAKVGQWTYYNKAGAVDSLVVYPLPKSSAYNSVYYHPDGKIALEGNMVEGKPEGNWNEFDETGKLIIQLTYKNGLFSGMCKKRGREIHYVNSVRNGLDKSYYNNGNIYNEQHYKNDILEGPNMEYYPNGQLKRKCSFKNGHLVGTALDYNLQGELINETNYDKRGAKTGYHKLYDSSGILTKEGAYLNGYKVGLWLHYRDKDRVVKDQFPTDLESLMSQGKGPLRTPSTKVVQYDPAIHSK